MEMKKIILIMSIAVGIYACSGNAAKQGETASPSTAESGNPSYDPERGTGKFTKVEIPATS